MIIIIIIIIVGAVLTHSRGVVRRRSATELVFGGAVLKLRDSLRDSSPLSLRARGRCVEAMREEAEIELNRRLFGHSSWRVWHRPSGCILVATHF
jgi:hypothetical protein